MDPLLHPVKPGVGSVLVLLNLSIFRTAASKPAPLSFVEQNIFSLFFPIIGLGPYTVGVKIKDFNSGVGINPVTLVTLQNGLSCTSTPSMPGISAPLCRDLNSLPTYSDV